LSSNPEKCIMNINDIHESSEDFHILETTGRTQTATITLKSGEATSEELNSHPHSDQTIVVMDGELEAEVGGEHATLRTGQSVIIPAGVKHRLRNSGEAPAFAFSVYCPPAYETGDPH
jgi:mannose-6-phosphate isomerase-like protein (cupin superfamily)